jgi:hypothetical protein
VSNELKQNAKPQEYKYIRERLSLFSITIYQQNDTLLFKLVAVADALGWLFNTMRSLEGPRLEYLKPQSNHPNHPMCNNRTVTS